MIRLGDDRLDLRPVTHEPDERAMVFATWIRSYKETALCRGVPAVVYFLEHERVIARLLSLVQLAFRKEAPTVIHAWVCGKPGVLHYAYVRPDIRRHGVCRQMVEAVCGAAPDVTHRWPYRMPAGWKFNPYLAGGMP